MFKIATILRRKQAPNLYRRILLNAFSTGIGDEYLLCSGFFQEKKYKKNSYFASGSFIGSPPALPCQTAMTTVGVYDKRVWGAQYDDFVRALGAIKCSCGVSMKIEKRVPKAGSRNKWHAKVFIVRLRGTPQLAIIGSSNITRNAFDEMKGWNRECDTVIWNSGSNPVDSIVRRSFSAQDSEDVPRDDDEGDLGNEVIVSRYDPEDSLNSSSDQIDNRLAILWNEILDSTTEV